MKMEHDHDKQDRKDLVKRPLEGILYKYTNVMKGWQYRWFVVDPETGRLDYYEKEEHKQQKPRGSAMLQGAQVSPSDEDSQTFSLNLANGEIYRLRAQDAKERQQWVNFLRATAELQNESSTKHPTVKLKPSSSAASDESTGSVRSRMYRTSFMNSQFRDVQEVLHQCRQQNEILQYRISGLPAGTTSGCCLDTHLLVLKATSSATLSCLNQCLQVLMKHEPCVEYHPPGPSPPSTPVRASPVTVVTGTPIPMSAPVAVRGPSITTVTDIAEVEDAGVYQASDLPLINEEQKSVILHLLTQLKLGSDLTKVSLPTFILEQRSLLEMFADCMSHPDLFLSISDKVSAEQRMLTVYEWYLASFHAGRRGSLAKKPYNPIIGEYFKCSWLVPSSGGKLVRLRYTGEQVSHHPPISAFFFECPEKQMYMNGSIYTRSRFLGMSIGVLMIGKVSLYLRGHQETYEFTLPSAYARSILTVPWVELGDRITITCLETRCTACVNFHTKPFYGGTLHRVSGDVKDSSGEVICRASGDWSSKVELQMSGTTKTIDMLSYKVYRKWVRPIAAQGDMESRRLWQRISEALKRDDLEAATQSKQFLEEQQRQGEKLRKEKDVAFVPQYFLQEGENWVHYQLVKSNS